MKVVANACRRCEFYDAARRRCSIEEGSPVRKCVIAINRKLLAELNATRARIRVLEIGCGSWSPIKEGVSGLVEWHGIDVQRVIRGKPTVATAIASVEEMPYPDEYFDFVYGNQSAEHWFEYGVTFERALAEISRVLKTGAPLHLNLPVHLHGNKVFLRGELDAFLGRLDPAAWDVECVEEWRKDPSPLPAYAPWRNSVIMSSALWPRRPDTAWILNVKARKRSTLRLGALGALRSAVAGLPSRLLPARASLMLHYGPLAIARLALSLAARRFTRRPPDKERSADDHD